SLAQTGKLIVRPAPPGPVARRSSDLRILGVARRAEKMFDLLVREPVDERRATDRRVAAAVDHFSAHPLKVLERFPAVGQHVHRVLHRYRADSLKTTADLHPQVIGLGWDLLKEEQPRSLGRRVAAGRVHVWKSIVRQPPRATACSYTTAA